jgi:hypothetical protein
LSKVLEVGLWPYVALGSQGIVNQQIRRSGAAKGLLASQALLYDTIVVPTMDFGIVPAFIDWLSLTALREALESETIKFLRYPAMIGYAGNGAGVIANLRFGKGQSSVWDWTHIAAFESVEQAIDAQVKHGCHNVPDWERSPLISAISKAAIEFNTEDEFSRKVAQATYQDIAADTILKNEIGRMYGNQMLELDRLPGPEPNQIRFFNSLQISRDGTEIVSPYSPPRDGIDLTLAVAQLNVQLGMASWLDDCVLSTFDDAARILEAKIKRTTRKWRQGLAFYSVLQIPGVPNIQTAVADGRLELSAAWAARATTNARKFRTWLKSAGTSDGRELARLYVDLLGKHSVLGSLPVRALKWAILATAGAIASRQAGVLGEIATAAAGGIDSLFLEKWLSGWSPVLFIDELRRIRIEPTPIPTGAEASATG